MLKARTPQSILLAHLVQLAMPPKKRPRRDLATLAETYNDVVLRHALSLDWVARHKFAALIRRINPGRYHWMCQNAAPDQLLDGFMTSMPSTRRCIPVPSNAVPYQPPHLNQQRLCRAWNMNCRWCSFNGHIEQ